MAHDIFKAKYADEKLIELIGDTNVHCWHLAKISGDREVRQTF